MPGKECQKEDIRNKIKNKRRLKNKITKLTRKGKTVKIQKMARKAGTTRRRKKLKLNFNRRLPEVERKLRTAESKARKLDKIKEREKKK